MTPSTKAALRELQTIACSSPVYGDLCEQATKLVGRPPKGETSLQKYVGTNVYQWHYRTEVYWQPWGQMMFLDIQPEIESLVMEARIEEVEHCRDNWHGTDDAEFADLMNSRHDALTQDN